MLCWLMASLISSISNSENIALTIFFLFFEDNGMADIDWPLNDHHASIDLLLLGLNASAFTS
uniref:Uncharacterized protein n=1 Tax=Anopheles quadriannulatus TaxID=34691 RepID=A0A182XR33_ANOQN